MVAQTLRENTASCASGSALIRPSLAWRRLVTADHIEKFFTVELELHFPDAVYASHLPKRRGFTARHLHQAAVRQNHVGRDRLRLGERRDGLPAQLDSRLALEDRPAGRLNGPAPIAGDIERQHPGGIELAENRAPFVAVVLLADPEGR